MLLLSGGSEERHMWISGLLKTVCRDKDLRFHLESEFKSQRCPLSTLRLKDTVAFNVPFQLKFTLLLKLKSASTLAYFSSRFHIIKTDQLPILIVLSIPKEWSSYNVF